MIRIVHSVERDPAAPPHERIRHLCGDGWSVARETAMEAMEAGSAEYAIRTSDGEIHSLVVATRYGRKVLSVPGCPLGQGLHSLGEAMR